MKKKEALEYIRKQKGYVPYVGMFEIYDDNDIIPKQLIEMSLMEYKPKGNFILCSSALAEQLANII